MPPGTAEQRHTNAIRQDNLSLASYHSLVRQQRCFVSSEKWLQPERRRLIVFDVEGVLIPKNRFIFEVGKTLGFQRLVRLLFFGFLYEAGILKLKTALKHIFKDLKGIELEALMDIFSKIPAVPYLHSFFCQLKARNCKIALISSGLPTVIVEKLATGAGCRLRFRS